MKKLSTPIIITLSLILLTSCEKSMTHQSKVHYETFITQGWAITLRDSIIASVEWATTSDLAFKNWWRIVEIDVQPGDIVKKWQVLARLDNNQSEIMSDWLSWVAKWLSQVQQSTESIRAQTENMKQTVEKLYNERIEQSENNIKKIKNELIRNEKNLTDTIDNLDQNYVLQLNNIINLANSSIHEWDKILWITSNFEYLNDWWEDYLWTRNWSSKSDAINAWGKLYWAIGELRKIREKREQLTPTNSQEYIKKIQEAYNDLRLYNEKMVFMLENSVVWAWLSLDSRDSWTIMFNTYKSRTSEAEWIYIEWKNIVTPLLVTSSWSKSSSQLSIDSLRIELENAEKNKDILVAEKKTKLRELSINILEIEAKKWELWTKIAETKMNEFLALDTSDSDIIRAPYDGVILEKYMNIGNIIWQWVALFRITSDDRNILKTYIDNTLYEFASWTILNIESPIHNTTLSGVISLLQKERDPIHNKNYTEITLSGTQNTIWERMIIKLARKRIPRENWTIIPVNSIITRYWPAWVFVIDNGYAKFQLIELLASDTSFAEVIGIREWSTIVTRWKESLYDWQLLIWKESISGE